MQDEGNIEDWIVRRLRRDLRRVIIRLPSGKDVGAQLVKLRALVPDLANLSPRDLLERGRNPEGIDLGIIEGREAWALKERLLPEGFVVDVSDASRIEYLPIQKGDPPMACIIEDNAEAEAFCLDLIARGCVVEEQEG